MTAYDLNREIATLQTALDAINDAKGGILANTPSAHEALWPVYRSLEDQWSDVYRKQCALRSELLIAQRAIAREWWDTNKGVTV